MTADDMLDVEGAAKLLGVSKSWIYRRTVSGEVPSFLVGGSRRFSRRDLEAWLEEQRQNAARAKRDAKRSALELVRGAR